MVKCPYCKGEFSSKYIGKEEIKESDFILQKAPRATLIYNKRIYLDIEDAIARGTFIILNCHFG